jgi:hypothetical protein
VRGRRFSYITHPAPEIKTPPFDIPGPESYNLSMKNNPVIDFTKQNILLDLEDALLDPENHEARLSHGLGEPEVNPPLPDFDEAVFEQDLPEVPAQKKEIPEAVFDKINEIAISKVEQYFRDSEMFNRGSPRSLMSLLPSGMADLIMDTLRKNPELFELYLERDDSRFEKLVRPTITDNLLRMSFWNEYYRVQGQGDTRMRPIHIYEAVCPRDQFYNILQRPHRVMWILTPPQDQIQQMEVLLQKGIRRLDEILSLPMVTDGKVNIAVANLIMKTAVVLDVRLRGQATQKVEITNKHEVKMSPAEIDKKLRELDKEEAEIKAIATNPGPDKGGGFATVLAQVKHTGTF